MNQETTPNQPANDEPKTPAAAHPANSGEEVVRLSGTPKSTNKNLIIALIAAIVSLAVVGIVGIIVFASISSKETPKISQNPKQSTNSDSFQPIQPTTNQPQGQNLQKFYSDEHDFRVGFSIKPNENPRSDFKSIPLPDGQRARLFIFEQSNAGLAQTVQITKYPDSYDFDGIEAETLDKFLTGFAGGVGGEVAERGQTELFRGKPSLSAIIKSKKAGIDQIFRLRIVVDDEKIYAIISGKNNISNQQKTDAEFKDFHDQFEQSFEFV